MPSPQPGSLVLPIGSTSLPTACRTRSARRRDASPGGRPAGHAGAPGRARGTGRARCSRALEQARRPDRALGVPRGRRSSLADELGLFCIRAAHTARPGRDGRRGDDVAGCDPRTVLSVVGRLPLPARVAEARTRRPPVTDRGAVPELDETPEIDARALLPLFTGAGAGGPSRGRGGMTGRRAASGRRPADSPRTRQTAALEVAS